MRQMHGATQNTVDKVFALLEQDGLIIRERSRGTFVRVQSEPEANIMTGIIGLSSKGFLTDGNSAYWTELLRGLRDEASRAGLQLLLLDHNSNDGWDKVDGLVVCDWGARETGSRLAPSQPTVSIMVDVPTIPSVVADDFCSGRTAAEHLLTLGHRRIGVLHNNDRSVMPLRLSGYRNALLAAGITPEGGWQRVLTGQFKESSEFVRSGADTMSAWLRDGWKESGCTAIICQNDAVAMGAIRAIREAGMDVPNDISVIGHDGTDLSLICDPPLTTIILPLYDIGVQGIEIMQRRLRGEDVSSEHRVLPVTLVQRDSTDWI
jgi:DNA-binding LacI/PurR family transcriptional regulator